MKKDYTESGTTEMWCWRGMDKISWTDPMRNEKGLHRVRNDRNVVLERNG
jgi:hypothetical protein